MIRYFAAILALVLLLGDAGEVAARAPQSPPTAALVTANNAFGFALFDTLFSNRARENVFISPLSTALALDLAYDGARGGTATAMARTLRLTIGQSAVRSAARPLLAGLAEGNPQEGLAVADSLWSRSGVSFRTQFLQHARTAYSARVTSLDFSSPSAPATINAWVKSATHGKIATIVDRIPPDLILYLINAVYFHGAWAQPFNPNLTRPQPFALPGGGTAQVPMMTAAGDFAYDRGANLEMIDLPYHGNRFRMEIALPASGVSLQSLARRLSPGLWSGWRRRARPLYGSVSLPRFTFSNDFNLTGPLTQLGMGSAFSDGADFSGMCVQPCRLSQARHKTFLSVNEQGTTAAAVTSIGVSPTAARQPAFTMVVDRPFLVAIDDSLTGSILFLGAVNRPG